MTRIIIADDHTMFRQGLAMLLGSVKNTNVVAQTGDGNEALNMIIQLKPDLAVIDISMPGLNGIEIARYVHNKRLNTKIILLTMHTAPELAKEVIKYNISGYLLKENAFEDLLSAIQTVAQGKTFISPMIDIGSSDQESEKIHNTEKLTRREEEILKFVAKGLTSKEIANKLNISVKTVETHRANIIAKLDLHSTADLVKYAIHKGITKT